MSVKYKNVKNFPDYYVGSDGSVVSTKNGSEKQLKTSKSSHGYASVTLRHGNERQYWQVHRLVATMFIRNKKNLEIVNHKDGNKLNNNVANLEWVTRKGNAKHYETELAPKQRKARQAKKDNDMKARLSIVNYAHTACTSNPELFYSIYKTAMGV